MTTWPLLSCLKTFLNPWNIEVDAFFPPFSWIISCRSSQIWCLCIWSWPFPPGLVPLTLAVNSVNSAALRRPTRCWERKAFFGTWPWRKCKKCPSSGWKPMQLLENLDEILMKLWSCLVMFSPTIFWNGMKQVLFLSERWTLWACLDVLRASCQSCHFSFSYLVIGILLCRFSCTHIWFQVLMQFPTVPFPLCLSDLWVLSWTHLYRFCWGFSATLAPQSLQIVSSLHFVSLSRYLLALASCVMRATEVTYTSALDVSKHHWLHSCELLKHIAPSCYSCSAGIVVWDVWRWELLNVSSPQSRLCSSSGLWDGRYSATGGIELLQPLTCFLQGKKTEAIFLHSRALKMKKHVGKDRWDVPRLHGKSLYPCANEVWRFDAFYAENLHFEEKLAIETARFLQSLLGRTTNAVAFQHVFRWSYEVVEMEQGPQGSKIWVVELLSLWCVRWMGCKILSGGQLPDLVVGGSVGWDWNLVQQVRLVGRASGKRKSELNKKVKRVS